jgi:dCTP deaminase
MILVDHDIRDARVPEPRWDRATHGASRRIFDPFSERTKLRGLSYGLSMAGYDIRIAETITLGAGTGWRSLWNALKHRVTGKGNLTSFSLASSVEHFVMPRNVLGIVHDKSTHVREGITVQNTVVEPGWHGFLTLELTNESAKDITIKAGTPIAQIVLHLLTGVPDAVYDGKYQGQAAGPQAARYEPGTPVFLAGEEPKAA